MGDIGSNPILAAQKTIRWSFLTSIGRWVLNIYFNLNMKKIWRVWAKALGEKAGTTDKESDVIAITRTVIVLTYIITNICIIAGIIRHW